MSSTTISAVVARRRRWGPGRSLSVVSYERPWVRTDVELGDGKGVIVLRYLGRAGCPGSRRDVEWSSTALPRSTGRR